MPPAVEVIRADAKIAGSMRQSSNKLRTKLEWSGCAPTGLAQRQTALGLLRLPGLLGGNFSRCEPSAFSLSLRFQVRLALEHFYMVVVEWWSSGGGVVA